jgi:hypothetical protein
MELKRQRWTPGAVVQISLGDGYHAFAQMLDTPEYAFFDLKSIMNVSPAEATRQPVLFRLWVNAGAHLDGRWRKIGRADIPKCLSEPVYRYKLDPIDRSKLCLTYDGSDGPPATIEECAGLECASVWDAKHVEDRLRDHFAGLPNKWAMSLRLVGSERQNTNPCEP